MGPVSVQRVPKLIDRRLTPPSGMVAVLRPERNGRIQSRDLQGWVRGRRPVALHIVQPRRGVVVSHAQRQAQGLRQLAGLLRAHLHLVLLALVVHLPVPGHALRLGLILEEGVVEDLMIDVKLAHLRSHFVPGLAPEPLGGLLLHDRLADLGDPRGLDVLRELERGLLDPTLPRHVPPLVRPVPRHSHGVPVRFQKDQMARVRGMGIPNLDDVRPSHQALQHGHRHPVHLLPPLAGQSGHLVVVTLLLGLARTELLLVAAALVGVHLIVLGLFLFLLLNFKPLENVAHRGEHWV
mmetsp:Transcript_26278/g.63300  ORF Transcript_26278/g.63300 Transcript_26278/m.63300 type:complete len:294 (-) Transcript_26278:268-1149(-)